MAQARERVKTERALRETGHKAPSAGYPRATGVEAIGTTASCIALGVVLPFFLHPFGVSPRVVLPMHFPVFLAGILLKPWHAAIVGVFTPALSMGLTGMPTADQALRMVPELATYAAVSSAMLSIFPVIPGLSERLGRMAAMFIAMLVAMIAGRLVYVLMSAWMMGFQAPAYYSGVLVLPALPGIVAQSILIPPLAYKLQRVLTK
ncbi:ECF transporter S component [candidate division KSB1 bacterium]|nr:ECF transporter S component [candidate division KSB1 bacterium]